MDLHALVIDSDSTHRSLLRADLSRDGWRVCEAVSWDEAMRMMGKHRPSLVFCDMHLVNDGEESNGLNKLQELKRRFGPSVYVVVTAPRGQTLSALEVILNGGASDFMRKPCAETEITRHSDTVIRRLKAARQETISPLIFDRNPFSELPTQQLIGESEAILGVLKELAKSVRRSQNGPIEDGLTRFSLTRLPTFFITGETGTGKELFARIIHRNSNYARGEFVAVNCSTLPAELAESELFGYCAGAFTGATKEKPGLWEAAHGGTLFLDEITEAPISVQPKLLRVLQEGVMRRVGSNRSFPVSVQVIAASNRDIQAEIEVGRFRRDLYYRLNMYKIHLPPLRERREDIPMLVEHFTRRHFTRQVRFTRESLNLLMKHSFPGNVRELENIVRGAARKSPDGVVYAVDLAAYVDLMIDGAEPEERELESLTARATAGAATACAPIAIESLDKQVYRFKLRVVKEALANYNNNVARAARALKISRPSMYRLVKEVEADGEVCRCRRAER